MRDKSLHAVDASLRDSETDAPIGSVTESRFQLRRPDEADAAITYDISLTLTDDDEEGRPTLRMTASASTLTADGGLRVQRKLEASLYLKAR